MDEVKIRTYLTGNGIPYTEPIYDGKPKLRVMDLTSLAQVMRDHFDERGFYKPPAKESKSGGEKK